MPKAENINYRKKFIMQSEDTDEAEQEQILPKTNNFKSGLPPQPSYPNANDAAGNFTLNKYESKPDLMKKPVGASLDIGSEQMQTASFNKQGGSQRQPVINSEQPTENTDKELNLID